jgi:hypothetical protein
MASPPVFRPQPALAPQGLQLKKASKREREVRKQQEKRINVRVQTHDAQAGMSAEASKGHKRYVGHSGNTAAVNAALAGGATPWSGLTRAIATRDFASCAEADIFMQLRADGENPAHYDMISYNMSGIAAPPCANCSKWVTGTFKSVVGGTKKYRARSRHTGS